MDFGITDEQKEIEREYFSFSQSELNEGVAERDKSGEIDQADFRDRWQRLARFGTLGLVLPKEFGGQALDNVTATVALHGLGRGCHDNGLLLAVNAQIWTIAMPILEFGTDAQKKQFLPRIARGEWIGADAISEVQSGSDAMTVATTAKREGDSYILNGQKVYVGQSGICDFAIVFAQTDEKAGAWGVSAFLVPMSLNGVERHVPLDKTGYRTLSNGTLSFHDTKVPAHMLLGREGAGKAIFGRSSVLERQMIFASHVGAMQRQLDGCITFARSRESGGQPIVQFQSISNRLADMQVRYETCWLTQMRAAWQLDNGVENALQASVTKLQISEALLASSLDAARIHGGSGYRFDSDTSRDLRDNLGSVILGGTSDIQRNIIAGLQRTK